MIPPEATDTKVRASKPRASGDDPNTLSFAGKSTE